MNTKPLRDRFWSKVKIGPSVQRDLGPCFIWSGSKRGSKRGMYGTIHKDGKMESAHRVAWYLATGRWPRSQVLHKCDVRLCVRRAHLFEGTAKDNMADKYRKGRGKHAAGEQHQCAKLTTEEVRSIRMSLSKGVEGKALSKMYGVSQRTISSIKHGDTWAI